MAMYISENESTGSDEVLRRGASRRLTSTAVAIERRQGNERRFRPGFAGLLGDLFGPESRTFGDPADGTNAR